MSGSGGQVLALGGESPPMVKRRVTEGEQIQLQDEAPSERVYACRGLL